MSTTFFGRTMYREGALRRSKPWEGIILDNFAGGGGASLGLERGTGRAVDLAINHDPAAVEMHAINHPASHHLCESVWKFRVVEDLVRLFGRDRFKFDDQGRIIEGVDASWFSPDCRHFSRAKGGAPVSPRVRGLAWYVIKVAKLARPRLVFLENVREFEDWAPLVPQRGPNGKYLRTANGEPVMLPDKTKKGQTFRRWVASLRRLGYVVEWRLLDAADYGFWTHRKRLFLIARCDGEPIVWPKPTHGPGREHPYHTAAECIDFNEECRSIFDRKKELVSKTQRRILMGLKRFVLDSPKPFTVQVNHGGGDHRTRDIERPMNTITGTHGHALITPFMVGAGGPGYSAKPVAINEPMRAVMTENHRALASACFVQVQNGSSSAGARSVERPAHTVTAKPKGGGMAMAQFNLAAYITKFRFDSAGSPISAPLPTITAGGNAGGRKAGAAHAMAVTQTQLAPFFYQRNGEREGQQPRAMGADRPCNTITPTANGQNLVTAYLMRMGHGQKQVHAADEPLRTIASHGTHHSLVYAYITKFFSSGGQWQSIGAPLHTVTTKDRMAITEVKLDGGWLLTDAMLERAKKTARWIRRGLGRDADAHTVWIIDPVSRKRFPLIYVMQEGEPQLLWDVCMRMLKARELARAQGFPDNYVLTGSNANQVHKIGNSVVPGMAELLSSLNFPPKAPARSPRRPKKAPPFALCS